MDELLDEVTDENDVTTRITLWGMRPDKTDIQEELGETSTAVTVDRQRVLRIRWRDDIDGGSKLREVRGSRVWEVQRVEEVGRRRFLDLTITS